MSKFQQMPVPPYPGERDPGKESLVKVAALQMEPHIGDKDHNIAETLKIIDQAGKMGARLMVLPELCNTGYIFNSREEAFALSEKNYKANAKDYELNLVSNLDVLQALAAYQDTERSLEKIRYLTKTDFNQLEAAVAHRLSLMKSLKKR